MEPPETLGRRLVHEMRQPVTSLDVETAADVLRWGADELDDEQVWSALMTALDEATVDDEFWALGDGFISESVRTHPALEARWLEAEMSNAGAAAVHRIMLDPTWNWVLPDDDSDGSGVQDDLPTCSPTDGRATRMPERQRSVDPAVQGSRRR